MSDLSVYVALALFGTFWSFVYSGAETGAYLFNRSRLRIRFAAGETRARMVQALTSDFTGFIAICLVGTNLANALVSFCSTLALEEALVPAPELVSTLLIAPLLFFVAEVAPKELYRRHPDTLLYNTAPLLRVSGWLFFPAVRLLGVVPLVLRRLGFGTVASTERLAAEERLRQVIVAGTEQGTLTAYQAMLARNIFALDSRTVAQAMVPLARTEALDVSTSVEDARAFAAEHGFTRYPVFRAHREEVVGLVSIYDLFLDELRPGLTIRNYVLPVLHVDPDEKVARVLVRLRQAFASMAVVSRDGRALGIITLKDLVEEITGELEDF